VTTRVQLLEQQLLQIFADLMGLSADEISCEASFVEQGFDSLSLTQATLECRRRFGLQLSFRRLLEDLDSVSKLATHLDATRPAESPPSQPAPLEMGGVADAVQLAPIPSLPLRVRTVAPPSSALQPPAAPGPSTLQEILHAQLQLMSQQLALIGGAVPPATGAATPPESPVADRRAPLVTTVPASTAFGAGARITLDVRDELTQVQREWLSDFMVRYNARTGKSKAFSQQHRRLMSDPRVVTGFNPVWKDLVYPIVVDRSAGASLWDLDGNEYLDLLSSFGANILGHQPDELVAAMTDQLKRGIEVGPQHPLAAEVASLVREITGMERVAFCNTGSEAVMGAMRIARTVTGRKTIAIFTNSYHGIFDEVIVRGTPQLRSVAAAPGILASAVENVLVLDWNSEASISILRERGEDLAAIMAEPVQNKIPSVQPHAFLRELRRIADAAGCALIFDEVVTGFRIAPGGAQEFYGVHADIATYGKILGGGLPLAAIAGASRWLDAFDGGHWEFSGDSRPEVGVTYFAGTFVRHPLALAAARATLIQLKRRGPVLYRALNGRTQRFIDRLNAGFAERGAPVRAVHCASLWRLSWDADQKHAGLFYYLARFHGLHLYEQFGHFVTEALGEAELDRVHDLFMRSLDELLGVGLLTHRVGAVVGAVTTVPGGDATEGPLAPGQTERWLAAAFDVSARRALNESFCVVLSGAVDVDALRFAIHDVISRHPTFRVSFDTERPRQILGSVIDLEIAEVDLGDQPDADGALDRFCTSASERDFALDRGPLAAVSLLRLADQRVVVHVVASHLVFDGWASSVFNEELACAYAARRRGAAPDLAPAESPLRFASEEQRRMEGPEGRESARFWEALLRTPPAALSLGDRQPPVPRRFTADTVRTRIDGGLFAALRSSARSANATLFQWLLGAVTVMLRQQSGQDEFVVSIPFASQALASHGPLMADGVLDLPLRLECQQGETGSEVLRRVRSRLMDALEHPLTTQGTVARALGIRSAGDRPPLTSIYFNLNPRVDMSGFAPLVATMHEGRKRGTLGELFFNFYEQKDSLTLDLHHSSEHFSPERAHELVEALLSTCRRLAASMDYPLQAIDDVPRMDERLRRWNDTAVALPDGARVEAWVSAQAAICPAAVAVDVHGTRVTYAELEAQSNRIGNRLRGLGIGAGDLVGICLGRGPAMIPAMLGILKTGAAYVPLDPWFPRERLHYMAADAALRLVVTESAHAALSGLPREQQLRVDDDAALIAAAPCAGLPPVAHDDGAPAYVIYTSGTTGRPKGVVVLQRSVCNFLASMRRQPGLAARDSLLAVTTLSFDIAVLELLLPLVVGARVVLAQREDSMDAEALARLIDQHGISVMQATPTTWHMLLDVGWRAPEGFRALCGGEALPPALAARLVSQGVELWNMYGPTETTVWSTLARIEDASAKITIGRPIDNTQVWILDESGRSCAVGVEGEICIGGAGVALGYLGRPELTSERFLPDPFAGAGARLYRTGDLGRWREDGTIEHLGRLDFQVKIRGYRIELGEIEARLTELRGVARAVVVAREDSPGDIRLAAYVVPQPGVELDVVALRDALRIDLPDYMLPQHVVPIDAFPLLPNGKIDRKALPAPAAPVAGQSIRKVEPPRSDTERVVCKVMQEVLRLADIGRADDFFSLGGQSLLAARVVAQLNREFGLQLGLRALFEAPTVERLSEVIDRHRGGSTPTVDRPPIRRRENQVTSPLTVMQERIRFVEEMHPGRVTYNAPSAHRLRGPLNLEAFGRAFSEIVRRQAALRTTIEKGEGGYVQRVDGAATGDLGPLIDLSVLAPDERETVLMGRLQALADETFDLGGGRLFKAALFRLSADDHALFFMTHHIVWDGWSFDIFYAEMSELYSAYCSGRAPSLPELPFTYGDFAHWHNEWLRSPEIEGQIAHWKSTMAAGAPLKEPDGDFPRSRALEAKAATEWMCIGNEETDPLRDLARASGTTLSIAMLSVYAAMMSQWLGDPSPSIGVPVRGRGTPELESIMGFFNNMLPIRIDVNPALTCVDWIKAVHRTMVVAYANQDVPFEVLAGEIDSGGGRSRALYQVMCSFQDVRARQVTWGNLSHERIPIQQRGLTEDINLWMVEIPGGIEGGFNYNVNLFAPATIAALRDRFLGLLRDVVRDPQQAVSNLLRLRPADAAMLDRWTGAPMPSGGRQADLFDAVERRSSVAPTRVAVSCADVELSHGVLWQRVAAFESHLGSIGAAHGGLAIVQVEDPLDQLVASLATLRIGMRVMSVPIGVSTARLLEATAGDGHRLLISEGPPCDEGDRPALWCESSSIPGYRSAPRRRQVRWGDDQPLPSSMDRSALSQLILSLASDRRLLETDSAFVLESDAPAMQIVLAATAWASGARLVLGANELATDGLRLAGVLVQQQVALLHASASTWRALLAVDDHRPLDLTAMLDVTESDPDLVQTLLDRGCAVTSMYRPSPMGVPVAAGAIHRAIDSQSFGRPLLGGTVSVSGADGQRVPPGVAGELRLAGTLAASGAPSVIRARWRLDGVLQYLGAGVRVVHLDGRRIDLDDLEARIRALPGVEEAAAAVRDPSTRRRCIVVGIQAGREVPSEGSLDWQGALSALVPGLHNLRIVMGPLPRLSDGRTDLAGLASRHVAATAAAATPTQQAIIDVWQELLGLTDIRPHDNFFELGGTSLTAMQAAQRLEQRLDGRQVSPRRFVFETVAQLADSYDGRGGEQAAGKAQEDPVQGTTRGGGILERIRHLARAGRRRMMQRAS
jgi:amino acid adenylation domain-containing protein